MWDQGLIYLFIAGTYTPLVCAHVPVATRTVALAVTWGAAAVGFYSKVVARHRVNALATWGYVLLGWGPALILMRYVPGGCLIWLVSGGLFYTLGIYFLKRDEGCRYFHAAWHIFVILGSACHYAAIMFFVVLGA
jgi:hemolysin III